MSKDQYLSSKHVREVLQMPMSMFVVASTRPGCRPLASDTSTRCCVGLRDEGQMMRNDDGKEGEHDKMRMRR